MNKPAPSQAAPGFSRPAGECQVMADNLELPRGSFFTAIAGAPAQSGDLVMFRVGRRTSVGRWLPNVCGYNVILLPGILIVCAGATPVWIVGKVVMIPPFNVCQAGRVKATPGSRN